MQGITKCKWLFAVFFMIAAVTMTTFGVAQAATYNSPSAIGDTGSNTLVWTGQGATNGVVTTSLCDASNTPDGQPNTPYLLWVFDTDGGGASDTATTPTLALTGSLTQSRDMADAFTDPDTGKNFKAFTDYVTPDSNLFGSVAFTTMTTGGGKWNLVISHGCAGQEELPPTTSVTTVVHLANDKVVDNDNPATTGAMVHDQVTLTVANASTWTGTMTVYFFPNNVCTPDTYTASQSATWTNDDLSTQDNWLPRGPLADGAYSYQAAFVSGTDGVPDALGDCEPFKVVSSITSFWYQIGGTGTEYTCTDLNNDGNCGSEVASKKGGTTYDFLVHVDVTNNSGVTQDVKVQGGLAAKAKYYQAILGNLSTKDVQITSGTINAVTDGAAYLDTSSTSNVVTWILDNMPSGTTENLYIWVNKGYSSTGLQAVTSSWSEVDCPEGTVSDEANSQANRSALGEAMPGCVKSNYTGGLQVNVQVP